MITYAAGFALSLLLALWATPVVRRAAVELRILDRPDGNLKTQQEAIPYLGGLAVYMAFLLTVGILTDFGTETLGLLLSGSIAIMVGLIDDFGVLTPNQKLIGQALAALVLVRSGTYVKLGFVPLWLAVPLSILWIITVANAVNIIDIMDGLASGVGAIAALCIGIANHLAGRQSVALLCVVLSGALLGFLRHNFRPAKIYLGDTGSLFIGFMLASLSMNAGYTRTNDAAAISPVLILGVPLFDLMFVIWVRWRKGIPVMKGSPDHFALRLRRAGFSVPRSVFVSYTAGALLGTAGLVMAHVSLAPAVAIVCACLAAALAAAMLLLRVEMAP